MSDTEKQSIPGGPVPTPSPTKPIKYRYEKSAGFRSYYVMGSWIRVNGNNDLVVSLFQELFPLPLSSTFEWQQGVGWKQGEKTEFPPDYQGVRQIETDIVLSLEAAKKVQANLAHFIGVVEKTILAKNQQKAQQSDPSKTV